MSVEQDERLLNLATRSLYEPGELEREFNALAGEWLQQTARLSFVDKADTDNLEPGGEKVAIYAGADRLPTHMARQLISGARTSKVGEWDDGEHHTLAALEGEYYGTVAQILKRARIAADLRA